MANIIRRTLATGNAKIYYQVENELEAVGTYYKDGEMHYVAAHPRLGLWLSTIAADNKLYPIGFVEWSNIKRIVVDQKNEHVFIVFYDYDKVIANSNFLLKTIHKSAFTHTFNNNGNEEKSIVLPLDLFSGNILPYLAQKVSLTQEEIERKGSVFWTIVYIAAITLIVLSIFL